MARTYKAENLVGLFIYKFKREVVFYDIFTKKAYVISNSNAREYVVHQSRLPAALVVAFVLNMIMKTYTVPLLMGLLVFMVWEFFFRRFIYRLPVSEGFVKPVKNNFLYNLAFDSSYPRLIILALVLGVMAVLAYWGVRYGEISGFYFITTSLVCAVCGVTALLLLAALIVKIVNR